MRSRFALGLGAILLAVGPVFPQFLGRGTAEWAKDLESANDKVRRNAAFALGKLGTQAVPAVSFLERAMLEDKSPQVREAAAFALGEISQRSEKITKGIGPGLIKALGDQDPLVRRSAVYALGCLGEEAAEARKAVEGAIADSSAGVRQNAAWALGRLGDAGVATLTRALRDPDPLVLREAAGSLALLDPDAVRTALPALVPLLSNRDKEVRKSALLAIIPSVGPEDAKLPTIYGPLQRALIDPDEETKRNAAFALSNIGGPVAAPALDVLVDALRRGDVDLKRQAAAGIRNIGPQAQKALPTLRATLQDPDPELRGFAALALGGLGKTAEPALPDLVTMLLNTKEQRENRAEAAAAIGSLGTGPGAVQAVPRLLQVLGNPRDDGKVRERILWALGVHNTRLRDMPGVYDTFREVLKERGNEDNRLARYNCAFLMGIFWGPKSAPEIFPVLLEYLRDDTLTIYKNKAIQVQGAGQEKSTGKASAREIGVGDGRKLAIQALTVIGPAIVAEQTAIVEQVRRLAKDQKVHPEFRKQCQSLLDQVAP